MNTKRTARFKFKDSAGKVFPVSIENPKNDLKLADVREFTNFITDNDIFRPYGSKVAAHVSSELVTVTVDELK